MHTQPSARRAVLFVSVALLTGALGTVSSWAGEKEVSLFFTGQAYAALYPCKCPGEAFGGVARRATALRNIRAQGTDPLVIEAGAVFGSGSQDVDARNLEEDLERTKLYLDALKAMEYDALLVTPQEFVFGVSFLKGLKDHPFVTSNIQGVGRPYLIKDVHGVRVGVLGVTDGSAAARGAAGWHVPAVAVRDGIRGLEEQGAKIIIVLSSLTPAQDEQLLKDVSGIDIVINGSPSFGAVAPRAVDGAIVLSTWWQARKAGLLRLGFSKNKGVRLISYATIELGEALEDDPDIAALLPVCMQDVDCAPLQGLMARCDRSKGVRSARCVYIAPPPLDVTVITSRACSSCRTEGILGDLEALFGKPRVRTLDASEKEARALLEELDARALPQYVFTDAIERHEMFGLLNQLVEKRGVHYRLKPGAAGVSFFMKRPRISGNLDIFIDLSYPHLALLMERLKELIAHAADLSLGVHYLAAQDEKGSFMALGGQRTIDEYRRMACLEGAEPEKFFDYMMCRAAALESGAWEACAADVGADVAGMRDCASHGEGDNLLARKIRLTKELEVTRGPVLLFNNQEIYGMEDVPSLEEFERKLGLLTQVDT